MSDGRRTELVEGLEGPRLAKLATDPAGHRLIAQEAIRLEAARHPGVVELLHHDSDRIELAWAGDRTIETAVLDVDAAAALLAAVAATVADLHDLGVVHGRLDPTHVIVGSDGRPRLCGMSGPRPEEPDADPAADVEALGRIIHRLVGAESTTEPIPERRWRRRRWSGYQQRALQNLADHAQADDPEMRPSARTLATTIAEVAPGARLARPRPDPPATQEPTSEVEVAEITGAADPPSDGDRAPEIPDDTGSRQRRRRRLLSSAALGGTAALVAVIVIGSRNPAPPTGAASAPASDPAQPSRSEPSGSPRSASTTRAPETTAPPHCTPVLGMATDVDDDGCPDPLVIEGTTITAGGTAFRAGATGDHVVVGDWQCTGLLTPGLVRPSTGEVYLFDRWPAGDRPLESDPVAIVPGGTRLVVSDGACGAPGVLSSDGELTHLNPTDGAR